MPVLFTRLFSERLDRSCPLHVQEAVDGQLVEAGHIVVAPGDKHLTLIRQGTDVRVKLTKEAPENYCRPAVDVLFRSVAAVYGAGVMACVLTGMGRDGVNGAEMIKAVGGRIVVQDEPSSVVWGMPGAIVSAGLASDVVPLDRMAETLRGALTGSRRVTVSRVLPASAPRADAPVAFGSLHRLGGTS
jgi:two-component system, chemotaxis family, protein-glutamate methylesterase/glutaminase